jgi:fatty acid desaturase
VRSLMPRTSGISDEIIIMATHSLARCHISRWIRTWHPHKCRVSGVLMHMVAATMCTSVARFSTIIIGFFMFVGLMQHGGLAENVLDHRLNSRTVLMNPVFRFVYWNMNYHIEHHMFPMVPYHNLPKLHEALKHDLPQPYANSWQAYREIIPAMLQQLRDPEYHIRRQLPDSAKPYRSELHDLAPQTDAPLTR